MAGYNDELLPYDKAQALAGAGALSPEFMAKNYPQPVMTQAVQAQPPVDPVLASLPPVTQAPAAQAPATAAPNVTLTTDLPQQQVSANPQLDILKALAPRSGGYDIQQEAVKKAAESGQQKAAEESAYINTMAQENEARIKQNEQNEIQRQQVLTNAAKERDAAVNEFGNMKVDSGRFWSNKATGDKVGLGIALALGALGGANGNGNMAVPIITDAIKRDIDEQKSNIMIAKDKAQEKRGIYGDMLAKFKDERLAEEATRLAYLNNAQIKLQAISSKYSGSETQNKADMLYGQIEQQKLDAQNAFTMQVMKNLPADPNNPNSLKQEDRERFVPGYGLALSKEDASVLKKDVASNESVKSNLNRLLDINKEIGRGGKTPGLDVDLKNEANSIVLMLQGQMREGVLGPGAVTDKERAILEEIIANPTNFFSREKGSDVKLKTIQAALDRNLAAKTKAYGLKSTQEKVGFEKGK